MWYGTELLAGLLLLYLGAEWLVKGAAGLGRAFRVRPLVIGLTVVAYGTSMPELVVSTVAAVQGMSAIALGNVIGSNIANLGLILGVTATLAPLSVEGSLIRRELPVMFGVALLLPVLMLDGVVSRIDAAILLGGAVAFTYCTARSVLPVPGAAAAIEADAEAAGAPAGTGKGRLALIALLGLALLLIGGQAFITGATGIATAMGISQRVIGLTIAAVGTSAPELAASIVAATRGHGSIAIGNVIGSNIFNVFFVLGGVAAIEPVAAELPAFQFDLAMMTGISAVSLVFLRGHRTMVRVEGLLLLSAYFGYLAAVTLSA
jgi:cation:H+ antiporter